MNIIVFGVCYIYKYRGDVPQHGSETKSLCQVAVMEIRLIDGFQPHDTVFRPCY